MIELRQALPQDLSGAEALWTLAFGDDVPFQQRFYLLCRLSGPLVLLEDGVPCSMLALPQVSLVFEDGRSVQGGYVYALTTHSRVRGRGYAGQLLDYAACLLKDQGADFLLTVPAHPSLFPFFARCGFLPAFYHSQCKALPKAVPNTPISPKDYAALREKLLTGRTHVAYGQGLLDFQRGLCPYPGSGLYRLELAHGPACAAVENWPEGPVVKELLCTYGDEEQGTKAAAALCGRPTEVRLPPRERANRPFGAIRWLCSVPPTRLQGSPSSYLGLAFD